MPNIALLNYCNLSCPYCFANEFISENARQLITLEQLDNIFNFLQKSNNIGKIGLIGGEPTLHPQLKDILIKTIQFCKENKLPQPVMFTNGIELKKYIKFINEIKILLNINEPDIIGINNWNKIINNLKLLDSLCILENQVTFGINLYPNIQDYDFIFKLAQQFNQSHIRCSIVAPTCHFNNIKQDEYYNILMKPIFLKFLELASQYNIKINMDCNKIPLCYFSEIEKNNVLKLTNNYTSYCTPVVDITPDMKASSCFGTYQLIDLNDFENLAEVERYFNFKILYPKILQNKNKKCLECSKFLNLSCQGGCLAFQK